MHRNPTDPTRILARELRHNMTDVERRLWHHLRRKQRDGYRFRRQHPIGPYISDFACLNPKLVIELDGSHHIDQMLEDQWRTECIEAEGFAVIRFWNQQVLDGLDDVLGEILRTLRQLKSLPKCP